MSIAELQRVVLMRDFPESGLACGDVGVVVHIYENAEAYEIEVFSLTGETITVATVAAEAVRPVHALDVASARVIAAE